MRHADSDTLQAVVSKIISASPLARKFDGVDIDVSDYNDENEFIRVLVLLKNLDDISDDEVDMVTSSIESAVVKHDDRFSIVRFSES